MGFLCKGPALGNPDARKALIQLVSANPDMTDAESDAELKKAGAKFTLGNKDAFVKSLPIAKLEPFVGQLKVTSVELKGLDKYHEWDVYWPDWTVEAETRHADGTQFRVEMHFEPFNGDLETLNVFPVAH